MPERFRVGVMGAGQIAQGFDQPGDARVLSMANAVRSSADFDLGGFFDIDPARSAAAEVKWSCAASPRDRATWLAVPWDVIYIATPDACHASDLRDALACRPRGLLVEKPVALDDREGRELLDVAMRERIPVLVNYPRRWHTGVRRVTEMIAREELGLRRLRSRSCVRAESSTTACTCSTSSGPGGVAPGTSVGSARAGARSRCSSRTALGRWTCI